MAGAGSGGAAGGGAAGHGTGGGSGSDGPGSGSGGGTGGPRRGGGPADPDDPKGLLREAYRIEGITAAECRSIFMDWALSLSDDLSAAEALDRLLARHGATHQDHPMTQILREGRASAAAGRPARRGGWRGRRTGPDG